MALRFQIELEFANVDSLVSLVGGEPDHREGGGRGGCGKILLYLRFFLTIFVSYLFATEGKILVTLPLKFLTTKLTKMTEIKAQHFTTKTNEIMPAILLLSYFWTRLYF